MLTPSFDVSQKEGSVIITIRVPYVKISEAEIYSEGNEFKFYCKPYFLHLHLPGLVKEDSVSPPTYDVDTSTLVVRVTKCNHGEHFTNLEMLTTLLPQKPKHLKTPLIEEIVGGAEVEEGVAFGRSRKEHEDEEFDWGVKQSFTDDTTERGADLISGLVSYGFALQHRGVFLKLQDEIPSIVDCPAPDHMTPQERRLGRISHEDTSFNEDHYLADLMDNDCINEILTFQPPWRKELRKWRSKSTSASECCSVLEPGPDNVPFNTEQRDQLKELPNKSYLLSGPLRRSLYLGLVDVIYAYAYDYRYTLGEGNVESAWTICKLSPTLSWLEEFQGGVHEVVSASIRRTLCYPLCRHWELGLAVLQDTRDIFRLGRRKLLQCVLDVKRIFNSCDPYYLLNDLYITDYAIWLQKTSVKQIQRLADELDKVEVDVASIGWDLLELEEAARLVAEEEEDKELKGKEEDKDKEEGKEAGDKRAEHKELKTASERPGANKEGPPNLDKGVQWIVEKLSATCLQDDDVEAEVRAPLIEVLGEDTSEGNSGESDYETSDTYSSESDSIETTSSESNSNSAANSEP